MHEYIIVREVLACVGTSLLTSVQESVSPEDMLGCLCVFVSVRVHVNYMCVMEFCVMISQ